MKTSELIQFFADKEFTDDQGYNLLVSDLFDAVPQALIETAAGQRVISYFLYKIQAVLFPAIRVGRLDAAAGDPGPEEEINDKEAPR
jgi:hypothetical protein